MDSHGDNEIKIGDNALEVNDQLFIHFVMNIYDKGAIYFPCDSMVFSVSKILFAVAVV